MLTELGKVLRNVRANHGWLLKDMSDALDMRPSELSAIENGKTLPSYDFAKDIAERMDITVHEENEIQACIDGIEELKEQQNESNY